ncbi:MAG: LysR family transcriptional regulator [Rhodospirillum sp.]|nr:LysR family transcriptional regulator [Rhodospirillum sp.]MCF8489737.1 LysR family transcriptional regulator [Rhodospirillum sp.]MCF8502781.1 LysR family transcriptional regulator [Rhodospirillum sp.]
MLRDVATQKAMLETGLRQPMLDNTLIVAFLAVVDMGSYTLAANVLHRTQSAVSLQVKRLEETLGTQLFENPRHQIVLTADGEAFLDYARRMVELNRQALASIDHGTLKGLIRIGSNSFYASKVLPSLLAEFCERYPEVQVELTTGGQTELSAGLGVRFDMILNFYLADNHEGRILSRERLYWIQSTHSNTWGKNPLPVALLPQDTLLRTLMIDNLNAAGRSWRMIYESRSVDATIAAVAAGLAVSISVGSRLELERESLRPVEDGAYPEMPKCVFTVEAATRALSRATKVFHQYLLDAMKTRALCQSCEP